MSTSLQELRYRSLLIFRSRFLAQMNPLERIAFLQLCNQRQYRAGEYIYYQGDPGTGMYIIETGVVELVVEAEGLDDAEKPRYRLEAPESFGALSVGYEMRRMSSAHCVTDCTLYGFFKPDLETLCRRFPKVGIKFLSILNMIALRQLQITVNSLVKHTGESQALALQFETYYTGGLAEKG